MIAATDWVRAVPEQIRPFVPARYRTLGTDGFGRSDGRERLRHFFEVNRFFITIAALKALSDDGRVPPALVRRFHELAEGDFVDEAINVLAFGLPGVGKSHAMCAVAHALVNRGYSVLFVPTYSLVQDLLVAKRNLQLPRALRKLDNFAVIVLDDLGYIQQSPDEAEVLFTLLAERYERRSVILTSNLMFSEWHRIFRDQMATAAAIDRLIHHAAMLEFDVLSFRAEEAASRGKKKAAHPVEATT